MAIFFESEEKSMRYKIYIGKKQNVAPDEFLGYIHASYSNSGKALFQKIAKKYRVPKNTKWVAKPAPLFKSALLVL